jgi:predicted enzyme related to lactoylglutathione lyase
VADREIGAVCWTDLTVPDAERVADFYRQVVGWTSTPCDMGRYRDFCMNTPTSGQTVAGVCHARGVNADLPPQWLIYIVVADVDASAAACQRLGGEVLAGPRELEGQGRFCVIRDPAGAVAALIAPKREV